MLSARFLRKERSERSFIMDETRTNALETTEGYEESVPERSAGKVTITELQNRTYEAIVKFMLENGYVPSVAHICRLAGIESPSTVRRHLEVLNKKGLISIKESRIAVPGIAMVDQRPYWMLRVV